MELVLDHETELISCVRHLRQRHEQQECDRPTFCSVLCCEGLSQDPEALLQDLCVCMCIVVLKYNITGSVQHHFANLLGGEKVGECHNKLPFSTVLDMVGWHDG